VHHDLVPWVAVNKAATQTNEDIKRHGMQCYSQFTIMPSFEQLELADEMGFMFWQRF
jgi:beta-galactosidase